MRKQKGNKVQLQTALYIINHVFLPPCLPQEDDFDPVKEAELLDITFESLSQFERVLPVSSNAIRSAKLAIHNLSQVRGQSGALNEGGLLDAFRRLHMNGEAVPVHVIAQNAGLILTKKDEMILVEAFEISPTNNAVMTTKGRLQRLFPGSAISMPVNTFQQRDFQRTLVHTLVKMSEQTATETKRRVKKAGQMHDEERDTKHPRVVTELLLPWLLSMGSHTDISRISKNTRDDVLWNSCLLPWRRSPLWLLIRVTLHLIFARQCASDRSESLYKEFLVFLMSRILESCLSLSLSPDLLYVMNAKIVRRMLKLQSVCEPAIGQHVHEICSRTVRCIEEIRSACLHHPAPSLNSASLPNLNCEHDTVHDIPQLSHYLDAARNDATEKIRAAFDPPKIQLELQVTKLPVLSSTMAADHAARNIHEFEAWVAAHLGSWLDVNIYTTNVCPDIESLVRTYHKQASTVHAGNPESLSIMVLTILELWIACDSGALHTCALLSEYDPGIPDGLLQSLLLPTVSLMTRLHVVESYIGKRQREAKYGADAIFRSFGLETSFAVRYFAHSTTQKDLYIAISDQAAVERARKEEELRQKQEQYSSLMRDHDNSICEYYEVIVDAELDLREQVHKYSCRKCRLRAKAESLTIHIHEWPLPNEIQKAQTAVFELAVPSFFAAWRDFTNFVYHDVLAMKYACERRARNNYSVHSYAALSRYASTTARQCRVHLLSENKPHEVTHRKDRQVANVQSSDVCLNNGLDYHYYDSTRQVFIDFVVPTPALPTQLCYQLPLRSRSLQPFLFRPAERPSGLNPNDVIANQADCPDHMSVEEYRGLASIPIGFRIQWHNILLQLNAPTINFKALECTLIILQTILQAGPACSGDPLRHDGHSFAKDYQFVTTFLDSLERMTERLKDNWESSLAISTFISLTLRTLSLSDLVGQSAMIKKCMSVLANLRRTAFHWVTMLREKAHHANDAAQDAEYRDRAFELALICTDSFNVEEPYLHQLLSLSEAGSQYVQCCITVAEDNRPGHTDTAEFVSLLLSRWKRLSIRAYPILADRILARRNGCLDRALLNAWPAYHVEAPWSVANSHTRYWLTTRMGHSDQTRAPQIHYNLVTGELLVDGRPLSRLPPDFERHPVYQSLFGNVVSDVMPSSLQNMVFTAKQRHAGFTLHFDLRDSAGHEPKRDLRICAVNGRRKLTLIPKWVFAGEFPTAFIDEYVHWYDESQSMVRFCSLANPWAVDKCCWTLAEASCSTQWRLTNGEQALVWLRSRTAKALSAQLSALVDVSRMHIIFHTKSKTTIVQIPRIQLSFVFGANDVSIHSVQWKGMTVDVDQSLGTLQGLRDKLILRDRFGRRILMVPEGPVKYGRDGYHAYVHIERDSATRVQSYRVDDRLGRLVDNGSIQGKLFLAYLHALTSFCLPDPLTLMTGTEQALTILKSAAVRSFNQLTAENVDMLIQLARLTPGREYYPQHERVMQTVKWDIGLSSLAQHGQLLLCVRAIFEQAARANVFCPGAFQWPELPFVDMNLLNRDLVRSATYRICGFGAEEHTTTFDSSYESRDCGSQSTAARRAFEMADLIYQGRPRVIQPVNATLEKLLWKFLQKHSPVFGSMQGIASAELTYDAHYLQDDSKFVAQNFCSIHRFARRQNLQSHRYSIMIWLSTLAFAQKINESILECIAGFFNPCDTAQDDFPQQSRFDLAKGLEPQRSEITSAISATSRQLPPYSDFTLPHHRGESIDVYTGPLKKLCQKTRKHLASSFTDRIQSQWPCATPTAPPDTDAFPYRTYFNVETAMVGIKTLFRIWNQNYGYREYLQKVTSQILRCPVERSSMPSPVLLEPFPKPKRSPAFISRHDLFALTRPPDLKLPQSLNLALNPTTEKEQLNASANENMLQFVESIQCKASVDYERRYARDLHASLDALLVWNRRDGSSHSHPTSLKTLGLHCTACWRCERETYASLVKTFERGSDATSQRYSAWALAVACGQLPRVSPLLLLGQLARGRWLMLDAAWKDAIVSYALSLAGGQRADRLVRKRESMLDLQDELQNTDHETRSHIEYPEALLMEVESDILIRARQWRIVEEMMHPPSNQNAAMQLKMGEGKSSVIVPAVASALAQGQLLVRVFTAKPQATQMAQMLISKLGGLMNHRLYYLPFSRAVKLTREVADTIYEICKECASNGGILLVQPEHVLSLKLMGLSLLIADKASIAHKLLKVQAFFDHQSRDIVDESDENFSVKFELIYTMGQQHPVELSPDRWLCIQNILEVIRRSAVEVQKDIPSSIEIIHNGPGTYPRIRFLDVLGEQRTLERAAQLVCCSRVRGLAIARQPQEMRKAIFRYMTQPLVDQVEQGMIEDDRPGSLWAGPARGIILLLRGLFARNVLAFAFRHKRWRVHYGLARFNHNGSISSTSSGATTVREIPTRLAVPYLAKDMPTLRSEFSHTDVVLVLTQLSYYYDGLSDDDLYIAFDQLVKSDSANSDYQRWIQDIPNLPPAFRSLAGVNLRDRHQCQTEIFPRLRYSRAAINDYLAASVFPKEMREFPSKLSASGWDLGQVKIHPTTAFSGTIDSHWTLPTSVRYLELPEQRHTNAMILELLLRPETDVTCTPAIAHELLSHVYSMDPPVQVILDVGAQFLELTNVQVARQWLSLASDNPTVRGVIFFDDSHNLVVLDGTDEIEPFQSSPFAHDADGCLVFLDECHTRGTDLRLPSYYRAMATLGDGVTKDRLTQACMRMRKLGHGQSIVFGVPKEIKHKILSGRRDTTRISPSDVLRWAIAQTCEELRGNVRLWATQGRRFRRQSKIWALCPNSDITTLKPQQAQEFLEPESRTLERRYRPSRHTVLERVAKLHRSDQDDDPIDERLRTFQCEQSTEDNAAEQQERELDPEVQQQCDIERPAPASSAAHSLHPDLKAFVATGRVAATSPAVMPAFEALHDTSAASHSGITEFPNDLLVTRDFVRTIEIEGSGYVSDDYQRHVNWILTSTRGSVNSRDDLVKHIIIVSPYEAHELIPQVRASSFVTLHTYAARPSLDYRSLDRLDLDMIPRRKPPPAVRDRQRTLLNLFAGQLFLDSYDEYICLCNLLGLAPRETEAGTKVAADGFILETSDGRPNSKTNFTSSPVAFLKVLMARIRRRCESTGRTHIGQILDGNILRPDDFFDVTIVDT